MLNINSTFAALELGSDYARILCGRKSGRYVSVTGYGSCRVPEEFNYSISREDYIIKEIENILDKLNLRIKGAMLGIKGEDIIVRQIMLPCIKKKYIKQTVEYEFVNTLNINPDEYTICPIAEINVNSHNNISITAAAVPKKTVMFHINTIKKLGISLKSIDIFANTLAGLFKNRIYQHESVILVDIGHFQTEIVLIEDGRLYFHKGLHIGYSEIMCENYEYGCYRVSTPLEYIMDNVVKIVDFYTLNNPEREIVNIYLHGECAGMHGLEGCIINSTGINTKLFDIGHVKGVKTADVFTKNNAYAYLNCLSLLLKNGI